MKNIKKRYMKNASVFMAGTMIFTMSSENVLKTWASTNENVLFSNDFQKDILPDEVDGLISLSDISIEKIDDNNKALKFNSRGNLNGVYEFSFITQYNKNVIRGSKLEYDILIKTENKEFQGQLNTKGILEDAELNKESLNQVSISSNEFEDLGNGYSKIHIVNEFEGDFDNLYKLNVNIDKSNCSFEGDIYLDNITLKSPLQNINNQKNKEAQKAAVSSITRSSKGLEWNFNDENKLLDGWSYKGEWDYKGDVNLSYDKDTAGSGSLKLDVDYTQNQDSGWSEVKIGVASDDGITMKDYNQIKFNLYYNPNNMSKGSFKTKFFADDNLNTYGDINLSKAEDAGNGLKKVPVTLNFDTKDITVDSIVLSVIGCNTNYKGSLYIDDINLTYKDLSDIYVDKTSVATSNPTKIDINSLDTPSEVKLVDSDAIDSAASLLAYLHGVGKKDYAIFGHQNDTYNKAGTIENGSNSDVKDLTSSISGVCGIDTLSFTGDELSLPAGDTRDYVTAAADVSKAAFKEGAIVTLSSHMPNFAKVAEKGKDANGNYDYSGYTAPSTTGDVVNRILPGGDLNEIFTGYLDKIADYGKQLEQEGVPVLFRPFHENNGSWFWWGKAYCDGQTYKNLYAYTVEYLRDVKGVHNFLYVYSPNGPFKDEEDYLDRYPGDAFVDVMAFDQYHTNPQADGDKDPWFNSLKENIEIVQSAAKKHNKLATLSETGVQISKSSDYELSNVALPQYGNLNKKWFSDVSKIVSESDMPYFMVWANFNNKNNFYTPFLVSENKGHEMINEFIDYYNEDSSVFANGLGNYTSLKVNKEDAYEYGYIESPVSGSRILNPSLLKAKVKSSKGDVKFVIKDKKGNVIDTLNASLNNESGYYEGEITRGLLDKIGQQSGKVELVVNGNVESYSNYVFNIEEPKEVNEVVDDFESYGDEESLLNRAWNSSNGDGCSVTPSLITDEDGNHKMKFSYKISTEKISEGYAGVVKSKSADWSQYDALQLYIKPDGNAQKLVVQITSNGEAFEVFLPEFTATTEGKVLTIPFSEFKGKKNGKFDPSNIESFGLWCNTIVPEGHDGAFTVDSSFEFDNIKAVKISDVEALEKAEEAVKKAEESLNMEDIKTAEELVNSLVDSKDKEALLERINKVKESLNSDNDKDNSGDNNKPGNDKDNSVNNGQTSDNTDSDSIDTVTDNINNSVKTGDTGIRFASGMFITSALAMVFMKLSKRKRIKE